MPLLNRLVTALERCEEENEEGHKLLGSFFEALKPLNLQAINVENPGSHVTNLITERDIAQSEVARLQAEIAAAKAELDDTVPRSRYDACTKDWMDAKNELERVRMRAIEEIDLLESRIVALRNERATAVDIA